MKIYCFDGTFSGLLSCVFRAFQFKEFDVKVVLDTLYQATLLDENIEVSSNEQQAERVWRALVKKLDRAAQRQLNYAFLSEQQEAFQNIFDYCIYVFQQNFKITKNYAHPAVLGVSQWAKQVGREKHRMEAFVRFKKTKQGLYLALISPDFNVLPVIERHFKARYQDQEWLIYDEKRDYGIYYDRKTIQHVKMDADDVDRNIQNGFSQEFAMELDDLEPLYDQLWKDYFNSVNIKERQNLKLHIQYVPKRYWRYMNEKEQ